MVHSVVGGGTEDSTSVVDRLVSMHDEWILASSVGSIGRWDTRWRSEGTIRSEAKGGLSDSVIGAIEQDDKKRSRQHEDRQLHSSHNNRHLAR